MQDMWRLCEQSPPGFSVARGSRRNDIGRIPTNLRQLKCNKLPATLPLVLVRVM